MRIEEAAGIIEAEASVLDFQGKLAVAQCICDNRFDANAFTKPSETFSQDSLKAAELAILHGARRFPDASLLQFRSYTRYSHDGVPDWQKIYNSVPNYLLYLGTDSKGEYGHFYFGRWKEMATPFKMLVMAGHGKNMDGTYDPGACGCGYKEAQLTRELSRLIVASAKSNGIDCDLAPDRNHYSFFKAGGKYDVTQYKYVLEVHFNASTKVDPVGDGSIKGSMVYIDKAELGHSVEDAILQGLYDIGSKQAWDGVVITQRQYVNGLMVQNAIRRQGVSHAVLETCFISDADDMKWYQEHKELIATKVVEGIIKGFGLAPKDNPYVYVGKGFMAMEALEDMNIRTGTNVSAPVIGVVYRGQMVEVLKTFENGWMQIVWPGVSCGYAYTSNVHGKYYKEVKS